MYESMRNRELVMTLGRTDRGARVFDPHRARVGLGTGRSGPPRLHGAVLRLRRAQGQQVGLVLLHREVDHSRRSAGGHDLEGVATVGLETEFEPHAAAAVGVPPDGEEVALVPVAADQDEGAVDRVAVAVQDLHGDVGGVGVARLLLRVLPLRVVPDRRGGGSEPVCPPARSSRWRPSCPCAPGPRWNPRACRCCRRCTRPSGASRRRCSTTRSTGGLHRGNRRPSSARGMVRAAAAPTTECSPQDP